MPSGDACDKPRKRVGPRLSGYRPEARDVAEPAHEMARQLLAFWKSRSSNGQLLTREEIPAHEIAHLMGYLYLASPVDEKGSDWQYRLSGEALKERFGGTPVGYTTSQSLDPEHAAKGVRQFCSIAASRTPRIMRGRFLGVGRDFYDVEVVHLPILGSDKRTVWVLGGIFFFN